MALGGMIGGALGTLASKIGSMRKKSAGGAPPMKKEAMAGSQSSKRGMNRQALDKRTRGFSRTFSMFR